MSRTRTTVMAQQRVRPHRMRDLLVYILVGVLVVALAIALGVHQAKTGQKAEASLKWIAFAFMTLLIFWWTIRAYRPFWANAKFWKLVSFFAVIHFVLGVGLLARTTTRSLFPFAVITPLEYFLLSTCLSRFLFGKTDV
jgi:hypothetical protein